MPTIITITNQKGGVGKTTTAAALLTALHRRGARVLGVDLDPQGSLGFSLGLDIEQCATIYDVFRGKAEPQDVVVSLDPCDLLPSNILLSSAELEFNRPGREFLLKSALSKIQDPYDFVVIDTPPALNLLTVNAYVATDSLIIPMAPEVLSLLGVSQIRETIESVRVIDTPPALNLLTVNAYVATDSLIIPMAPEVLSLLGVSQIRETIESVRNYYNSHLRVAGILLNRFNPRLTLNREILELAEQIAAQLDTKVFQSKIRTSVSVAAAPAHGVSVLDFSPKAKPSQDFEALCDELVGSAFPRMKEENH